MHAMRRKDRQITDLHAIRTILDGEDVLHLGLCDGNIPYVVPMSYGYEMTDDGRLTLHLHCAGEGRKLELARIMGGAKITETTLESAAEMLKC